MDKGSLDRKRSTRDKWWVATAVLPGQLTVAFGMFGVVVALPNIITAFGTVCADWPMGYDGLSGSSRGAHARYGLACESTSCRERWALPS